MSVILDKLDRVVELATLPAVAMEVSRLLADEDVEVKEVVEVIEKDPAIVGKVLKLVNSSFYGFPSQISKLGHAAIILGNRTLHSTVISIAVCEALPKKFKCEEFNLALYWQHSVAVALIARELATMSGQAEPQEAFTCGLLHDIGKVILVEYFQSEFVQVWRKRKEQGGSFIEAERQVLDTSHAEIGRYVAQVWQLPTTLQEMIGCHHEPGQQVAQQGLLALIHVADILANVWSKELVEAPMLKSMDPDTRALVAEPLKSLRQWFPPLVAEIEESAKLFF